MASKIEVAYFRLRAAQYDYRSRESRMAAWLRQRLDERCYVSWSAGKDSTVIAHCAKQLRADVPILMVDPGVPIHWTCGDKAKMVGFAEYRGWNLRRFAWDKFQQPLADNSAEYRQQIHESMFEELSDYADEQNLSRRITGMRAEESNKRHRFLTATRGETKHTLQPIWDWSTEDVWTYIVRHDLPWLSIYDHLGPTARNGLIGKNGREHGRLVFLKQHYPAAFQQACQYFEARDYV